MASLSVYPLTRGKGTAGKVVLRLSAEDVAKVNSSRGNGFFGHQFVVRGSVKPFKAEIIPDASGTKFFPRPNGRMLFYGRFEDLHGIELGDDLKVSNLLVRIEEDRSVWLNQTTDTTFGKTEARPKENEVAAPGPLPMVSPTKPANFQLADWISLKTLFNELLEQQGVRLAGVDIVDGRVEAIRITHEEKIM